nr:histidine kinase N-terminal 7TM domain-containing protein [Halobellus ruber]
MSALATGLVGAAFVSAVIGGALALLAWRRSDTAAARPFLWFVLFQSAWSTATALTWLSPTFNAALAFKTLSYVFALGSLVSWVVFVVAYTRRDERFRGWPRTLFLGWNAIYVLLVLTNPVTELLLADPRPASFQGLMLVEWTPTDLFTANLLVIYGAVLVTYWLLIRFARRAVGGQGRQALAVLGGDLAFVGINVAYYVGGYSLHPSLDPSPIFFTVTVVVVGSALFAYDFLDYEPLVTDLLLEEMNDPIIVRDDVRGPIALNDAAARLVPEGAETLSDVAPALANAVDGAKSTVSLDLDGEQRTFDIGVSPIRTRDEQKRGDLLVLRDVTQQQRRQRELERQTERLDQFASVVSHDLRNPLSVASGRLELAREEYESDHLDRSADALDRMETLIDDLLTLARQGEAVRDPEPVELAELVDACWRTVATGEATLRTDVSLTVRADRSRLRQVLENLFRNAIDHGGPEVTVTVGELPDGNGFYVADDGPGVPEADHERIFESGYSPDEEGTGFGLRIVAEIVEAHGWDVDVSENENGGARFRIDVAGRAVKQPAE